MVRRMDRVGFFNAGAVIATLYEKRRGFLVKGAKKKYFFSLNYFQNEQIVLKYCDTYLNKREKLSFEESAYELQSGDRQNHRRRLLF